MRQIKLSLPCERIIGFTIPRGGSFFVCDHDEVLRIDIPSLPQVEVIDHHPYDLARENADFVGLHFTDCPLNLPLKESGGHSIYYDFNPKRNFVTVRCNVPGGTSEIKFRTLSGDWFCASLSDDGAHLVMAEPYDLALYDLGSG
jgi:hypothetical protein